MPLIQVRMIANGMTPKQIVIHTDCIASADWTGGDQARVFLRGPPAIVFGMDNPRAIFVDGDSMNKIEKIAIEVSDE